MIAAREPNTASPTRLPWNAQLLPAHSWRQSTPAAYAAERNPAWRFGVVRSRFTAVTIPPNQERPALASCRAPPPREVVGGSAAPEASPPNRCPYLPFSPPVP